MPLDSEPVMVARAAPDDLTSVIIDIVSHIQFKLLALMLLIFILISSDIFINRALSKFKGAVDYKYPTSWGVCLQGMFLVVSMIIVDGLVRQKII
jgi:hypothetical protein